MHYTHMSLIGHLAMLRSMVQWTSSEGARVCIMFAEYRLTHDGEMELCHWILRGLTIIPSEHAVSEFDTVHKQLRVTEPSDGMAAPRYPVLQKK